VISTIDKPKSQLSRWRPVGFNEISNVLRNEHASNIAARLEFGRDIGGNIFGPVF
jgi:hypothetical protein